MKLIVYISLLCLLGISSIDAQSEFDIVINQLNNLKKENSEKSFRLDSTLIKSTKIIGGIDLKSKDVEKDTIRSILRSKGNFDYNIEYIEISLPKTQKSDKILAELQNEKSQNEMLQNILNDTLYNNIGITQDKGIFKNKLRILATQNYIQFDDEFKVEFRESPMDYKQYNIVSGKSNIKSLHFNTYKYDKNNKVLIMENVAVELDSSNRFEIRVDITQNEGILEDIEVIDYNGKILSYLKNYP